jgi:tetratricopeptide (TPR) repeat protein
MKRIKPVLLISMIFVLTTGLGMAQDQEINIEDSAEVFLEEYSDAFQENFFEALKQKGIENYDKAINLLLECKLIDSTSHVVDYELAKVYLLDEQYIAAQEYAIAALLSVPTNLWYLNTLVTCIQMQGSSLDQTNLNIPFENNKLKENLALIYFKQKNYQKALTVLTDIKKSAFTKDLSTKIKDSISKLEVKKSKEEVPAPNAIKANPLEELKAQMAELMVQNKIPELVARSEEAIENYPSQPYFYYINGYALNKSTRHKEAVGILEAALDYMLDDVPLLNKIYQELVDAHTALNNSSEANTYLRMIKPGF